jgi:hypothetical protein
VLQRRPTGLLPAAVKGEWCVVLLERLCSAKRTIELTPHQAETWLASLSVYDADIVREVIVTIAHSEDPFPTLGGIVMSCERIRRERSRTLGQGDVRLSAEMVKRLSEAWGVL